ncbi:MAG: CAP domain-containing protein [Negativicutes bacterium]|nr:CAP domain-containing protein [Negativicutes bacterium]
MGKIRLAKNLFAGFAAFVLVATSWGGVLAPVANAAILGSGSNQVYHAIPRNPALVGTSLVGVLAHQGNVSSSIWSFGSAPVFPVQAPAQESAPQVKPAPESVAKSPAKSESGTLTGVSADEQQAFNLLNADRTANGLAPLRINSALTRLAGSYAQDMINRNFFSHTNPQGQSPFDRMRQAGIPYGYAGENLAINASVPQAEQAFMNSPGHRANILNAHYTQVGLGVRHSSNGSAYVVQEFTDG